jgi:hypothetical protein
LQAYGIDKNYGRDILIVIEVKSYEKGDGVINNFVWLGHHSCTLRNSDQVYRKSLIAFRDHG